MGIFRYPEYFLILFILLLEFTSLAKNYETPLLREQDKLDVAIIVH